MMQDREHRSVAHSFSALFLNCAIEVRKFHVSGWSERPSSESSLGSQLVDMFSHFEEQGSEQSLLFFDHSSRWMWYGADKPDIVFCDRKMSKECGVALGRERRCTWPMVCFVIEMKTSAFLKENPTEESFLTTDGYAALGQLANRCLRFDRDELFFGAVMDSSKIQFWRADAADKNSTRRWARWPASGLDMFGKSRGGFRGIDYLLSVYFNGRAASLRPGSTSVDLQKAVTEIRKKRGADVMVVPITPCRPGTSHAFVLSVMRENKTAMVVKLWPLSDETASSRMSRELHALKKKFRGAAQLAKPSLEIDIRGWSGFGMMSAGNISLRDYMRHLEVSHVTGGKWTMLKRIVLSVGRTLVRVHNSKYVHCDVKPANIVVNEANEATLVDFEHCVKMKEKIVGYTLRYCARGLVVLQDGNCIVSTDSAEARALFDWESLFFSVLDVLVDELAFAAKYDALEKASEYWENQQKRSTSWIAAARPAFIAMNPIKHLDEKEQLEAQKFMIEFADLILQYQDRDDLLDARVSDFLEK